MLNPQPNLESLHFKIGLSGTYWSKRPQYSILVNQQLMLTSEISSVSGQIQYEEFTVSLPEDQEHELKICLTNKTNQDTLETSDKTAILKDMLLNIESIAIDDIDIGHLAWTTSEFLPQDPSRPVLQQCVNLGWNGAYTLRFSSPFYLWLLERL